MVFIDPSLINYTLIIFSEVFRKVCNVLYLKACQTSKIDPSGNLWKSRLLGGKLGPKIKWGNFGETSDFMNKGSTSGFFCRCSQENRIKSQGLPPPEQSQFGEDGQPEVRKKHTCNLVKADGKVV